MFGFQVLAPNGTVEIDLDARLMRTLTLVNTGTLDGSVSVSGASQGNVLAVEVDPPPTGVTPVVTPTANGVQWSFGGAPTADRRDVTLNIMVY